MLTQLTLIPEDTPADLFIAARQAALSAAKACNGCFEYAEDCIADAMDEFDVPVDEYDAVVGMFWAEIE